MGTGETFAEAYYKSQGLGALNIPLDGKAFISVREADKDALPELAKNYHDLGFTLVATKGTAKVISEAGIPVQAVNKVMEGRPHIVDMLKNDEIDLIVNTTEGVRQSPTQPLSAAQPCDTASTALQQLPVPERFMKPWSSVVKPQ